MDIRTIAYIDHREDSHNSENPTTMIDDWNVLRMKSVSDIDPNDPPDLVIVQHPLEAHEGAIELVRDKLKHKYLVVFSYCARTQDTVVGEQGGIIIIRQMSDCITPGLIAGIESRYREGD